MIKMKELINDNNNDDDDDDDNDDVNNYFEIWSQTLANFHIVYMRLNTKACMQFHRSCNIYVGIYGN